MKKQRFELMKFDNHIGVYDTVTKSRFGDLLPKKKVVVKVPASAYESGFKNLESTDLHQELKNRRTVSLEELKQLLKKYATNR